jgi:hypothetical protein
MIREIHPGKFGKKKKEMEEKFPGNKGFKL